MWLGVYLLYCVLQESSGCTVDTGLGAQITGSVGDTVVLPCACRDPDPVNPQTVQWGYRKNFTGHSYTPDHSVFPKDGSVNQRYRDRVQRPTQNPPGQVSLIISPLTEEDGGTYVCGNPNYNQFITLYVGGCSVVGQAHTLTRSPGESVLLPCPCPRSGYVKPERVTWSYSKTESSDQTVSNNTGSYRGRVWTFDQTGSRNVSLLISDLTKEDEGQYNCKSDQHSAYVWLEVKGCALVENKQTGTVSRSSGESVLLSCTCTDPQDTPVTVQWRGPNREDLLQRSGVQRFTKTSPGNLSVLISDLTVEDGGTYSCWINQNQYRTFTLTVKVGSPAEKTTSSGCSVVGQAHTLTRSPGESVLLPCPCPRSGYVKPERVTWSYSKTESSDRTPVSNDTGSYRGRVWTFDQTGSRNLSLLISDLTKEDEGQYNCKSDQHSAYVWLEVKGCALVENKQTGTVSRSSGESVLLSCTCTDPQDTPVTVQWRGPNREDLLQRSGVQRFTKTSPGNLSVLISDLTVENGGTYSCWINQNQYRTFTLTVKVGSPAEKTTSSVLATVIIVTVCATVLVCAALLLIGGLIYRWRLSRTQGSVSTSPPRRTRTPVDDDYQNDPRNISMGPVYQSLDPRTNQSDSVYQSLNPKTNQSDSVYQSLNPKTNQSDSVYQSLNPWTN